MIAATRRWLRRNRSGIAIGVGVIGAGYLFTQYILNKLSEARERISIDRVSRENLRRRFEQNQTDCTFTVLALLPTATENILEALPVEDLTQELQQKKAERLGRSIGDITASELSSGPPSTIGDDGQSLASFKSDNFIHTSQMTEAEGSSESIRARPRRTKAQLWNEVKIQSITRSFTLLYTLSLLTLLTRIQLNLLGRKNYLQSVLTLASPPTESFGITLEDHDQERERIDLGNDFETNRRYLTFSWWLLHRGWRDLMGKVEAAVKETFGPLNPREDITLVKLSELTLVVRKKVEGSTEEERKNTSWLQYLLPPRHMENSVLQESGVVESGSPEPTASSIAALRRILDETSDLIESPPFSQVLTSLNNEAFSHLIDHNCAAQAFKVSLAAPMPTVPSSSVTITPSSLDKTSATKTKLANVLAVITKQTHVIGNGTNPPNEYLVAMEDGVKELEAFAAVVYSSNFETQSVLEQSEGMGLEPSSTRQQTVQDIDTSAFEKAWSKSA